MRKKMVAIPDTDISYAANYSRGPGGGGSGGMSVELSSTNTKLLEKYTRLLEERLKTVEGLEDVKSSLGGGNPEAKVIIDREKAKLYGINPSEINRMISYQVFGTVPMTIKSDLEEVDVELTLPDEYKESLEKVLESKIKTSSGKIISLSEVVHLEISEGMSEINKKNKVTLLSVFASLETGYDIKTMQGEIIKVAKELKLPKSIHLNFGGDNKMMKDMMGQLTVAFGIAIFLIYAILASQFESFLLPFIILGTVPLSVVGVYMGLMLTGVDFSVMVMIGVIMLAGIVVNNAIVLIDYTKLLIARGSTRRDAILEAGRTRLRPILMTSLTTMLGMMPLAFGIGQGSEMYQGMAIGVIFGLLISTLLTLLVIPVLFEGVENSLDKLKKKFFKDEEKLD
jgi:HAE1 family hydrophobic/amphiphilic exporter-1